MNTEGFLSYVFESQVWKLYPDPVTKVLVIETRDYDTRQAAFAAYDLEANKLLWKDFLLKEPWWVGIEQVYNGKMYTHNFHNTQFASHLNISCISIDNKEIIWEKPGYTFYKLLPESLIVTKNEANEDVFKLIDLNSDEITEDKLDVEKYHEQQREFDNAISRSLITPESFPLADSRFQSVNQFLNKALNVSAVHALEYLEHKNHIIISFYIKEENALANYLLIISDTGTIISNILMDENLKGIGVGAFFIFDNKLIFVKHKKELCIYDL